MRMAKAKRMSNRAKDNAVLKKGYMNSKRINRSNSGGMQLGGRRF